MGLNFFKKVEGDIKCGHLAKSSDINQIQTNIEEATREMMKALHGVVNSSFILGEDEDAFVLTKAPKQGGQYVDAKNLVTNQDAGEYLSFNKYGYRQPIYKSKSSCYAIVVRLKNDYTQDVMVTGELRSSNFDKLGECKINLPKKSEKECTFIFDVENFSVQPGRDPDELNNPDSEDLRPLNDEEHIFDYDYKNPENKRNFSFGATPIYFVLKPLGFSETDQYKEDNDGYEGNIDDAFGVFVDKQAQQGGRLERVHINSTEYSLYESSFGDNASYNVDLYYKDIYANDPTYLCTGGEAIINGERVLCMDTHVSVAGASEHGDVKSFVCLNDEGHLEVINSEAYTNENQIKYESGTEVTDGMLLIGIITTYMNDLKPSKIEQDDTNMITRKRSHHERLRRLEKEIAYQRDITIPPRLKYTLSGEDIIDKNPLGILIKGASATTTEDFLESSKYFVAIDSQGNFVIKSMEAEVVNVPVSFVENQDKNTIGKEISHAEQIVSNTNINIDYKKKTASLNQASAVEKAAYEVGTTAAEAKKTISNPWDDSSRNRPTSKTITPTERVFTVNKDKVGANVWSSEFPAMTLYVKNPITLKSLTIPITKFKNIDSVRFIIWKRQHPNNRTNTVWLEKKVYTSKSFSLKNAKVKGGYQYLDKPFTIEIKNGLKLTDHQYIVFVLAKPKSGKGSVFVETYKPQSSKDFLIRYYGSGDASHFLLKDRYYEIWYNKASMTAEVDKYLMSGTIESGTITWNEEEGEPVNTVSYDGNINTPSGCGVDVSVNCGSGWVKLPKVNTAYSITGGERSFKWRAVFKSNGENTPKISYSNSKKYALNFKITKNKPKASNTNINEGDFNNNCITTNTFYPGDILHNYIGDDNFSGANKFSNYEYLRLWSEPSDSEDLIIDICASNKRGNINTNETKESESTAPKIGEFDIFTLFYADLTLDDFNTYSVDYSNYDGNVEYDEHNLRFKIDTEQAYNDNEVSIFNNKLLKFDIDEYNPDNDNIDEFRFKKDTIVPEKPTEEGKEEDKPFDPDEPWPLDSQTDSSSGFKKTVIKLPVEYESESNTILTKFTSDNYMDLRNYSGLKLIYTLTSDNEKTKVSKLGLYISSDIEEEAPTNKEVEVVNVELPKELIPRDSTLADNLIKDYYGKVFAEKVIINGVETTVKYEYKAIANSLSPTGVSYVKQQYHNINSSTIFYLPDLTVGINKEIIISIDKFNEYFQYIKEIGIMTLNGEKDSQGNPIKFALIDGDSGCELSINQIYGVVSGYTNIYNGTQKFTVTEESKVLEDNKIIDFTNVVDNTNKENKFGRLNIKWYNSADSKISIPQGKPLYYLNNDSITTDAKHFAIQIATDTWLPKNSFKVELCSEENGINPVYSLNVPTLNYLFYEPERIYRGNIRNNFVFVEDTDYKTVEGLQKGFDDGEITSDDLNTKKYRFKSDSYLYPRAAILKEVSYTPYINCKETSTEYQYTIKDKSGNSFKYNDKVIEKISFGGQYSSTEKIFSFEELFEEDGEYRINDKTNSKNNISNVLGIISALTSPFIEYKYKNDSFKRVNVESLSIAIYNSKGQNLKDTTSTKITDWIGTKIAISFKVSEKVVKQTDAEWAAFYNEKPVPNFSQVYKKINEDNQIKSIRLSTTDKFSEFIQKIKNREKDRPASSDIDKDYDYITIFIKNIFLHEAEHIPLFHPNVRMKLYGQQKESATSDVDSPGVRKVGAVIEYK